MIKPRLQLVTDQEAAVWFRVPASTIRRWAVEENWRQYGGPRSRKWNLMEIQRTYSERRTVDGKRKGKSRLTCDES